MAKASATVRVPASADKVWQLIGGFDALPDWLPFVSESVAAAGGRIRQLTTQDGARISEQLQRFDEQGRTYSYSIVEGPLPLTDYLATLTVRADGAEAAFVEWSSTFTPVGISDAEAEALILDVYNGGLGALKANFG
ncbi:SRPBCC family protein [Pseudomonas sp. GD03842]|uniref:SRPBCC family protein n=1 Tax=Pseudomonas sp. GD03842 TaxID=2975385 RepID=UPI002447080D|nr:SRPBCC family protein [Pseudomonas sp. GD03842]MDH0744990.1 SRPBCC family protein [Pseudomonas sp. GD03842]